MFENKTEEQAKKEILDMVAEYCDTFHNKKKEFEPGDRITYASRVYDHEEMCNLVDSALEFWLTSGRYTDEFEKAFADALKSKTPFVIDCIIDSDDKVWPMVAPGKPINESFDEEDYNATQGGN